MTALETLRLALLNLALHKFRSLLATLGVILGVASVELMISIIEGARRESLERYVILGLDNILVQSVRPSRSESGPQPGRSGPNPSWVAEYGLLRRDLAHIRNTFPLVRHAVGLRDMRCNLYAPNGATLDLQVMATEPEYLHITRSTVLRGRFLTDWDAVDRKRVCVLGSEAGRRLFGYRDPLAESVRVSGTWFRVVGILENRSALKAAGGEDINKYVFVPLATAQAIAGDQSIRRDQGAYEAVKVQLDAIALQMADPDAVLPAAERLAVYLEKTHQLKDYRLSVPLELMRQKEAEARTFAIVMGSIAGISLLVGGIGIMNIMLANVSDRRKEIGTRRALGARRRDILVQFLFEAATLTSLGGLFGAGLGYALTPVISHFAGWPTAFTLWSAALGMGVSCFVGILFGLWPAYQAAKVSPIEALRAG